MALQIKKIAWITGASSGLGRAVALRLAHDGWYVAATGRRKSALEELETLGTIKAYPGDVTDPVQMRKIVAAIEKEMGPIDMALLNAGTSSPTTLENFTVKSFRAQYDPNPFGVMNALEPVLARFKKRGQGHIAVVASVAGYRGLPQALAYGSSKAALIHFCESLATECIRSNIKVQVINPGFVKTPMTDKNEFAMPMLMDVDKAARKMVRGLYSNRFEITFPGIFVLFVKIFGLLPGKTYIRAIDKIKDRQFRMQQKREERKISHG